VQSKHRIAFFLLSLGCATLAQIPVTVKATPSKAVTSATEVAQRVDTSIVRVTATFSYQVQEAPNPISGAVAGVTSRAPFVLSGPVHEGPNEKFTWMSTGTGFIIDPDGHIVTADHVINPSKNKQEAENALRKMGRTLLPGSFQRVAITVLVEVPRLGEDIHGSGFYDQAAKVFKRDEQLDVAILACRRNLLVKFSDTVLPRSLPEFQKEPARSGDVVSVSGYPATSGSNAGMPTLTTTTGIVSNSIVEHAVPTALYLVDVSATPGDSGAPVVISASGRIIGLVAADIKSKHSENSGGIEVIPIRPILGLLPLAAR
jgi:V8-like Glu-specific endopeptidase